MYLVSSAALAISNSCWKRAFIMFYFWNTHAMSTRSHVWKHYLSASSVLFFLIIIIMKYFWSMNLKHKKYSLACCTKFKYKLHPNWDNSQGKNNNNNDSSCTSSLNLKHWKKLNRQTYITDYIHMHAFALMCAHTAHQSLNSLLKSFQNKFGVFRAVLNVVVDWMVLISWCGGLKNLLLVTSSNYCSSTHYLWHQPFYFLTLFGKETSHIDDKSTAMQVQCNHTLLPFVNYYVNKCLDTI